MLLTRHHQAYLGISRDLTGVPWYIFNKDVPDDIKNVDENIVNKVIECKNNDTNVDYCVGAFKIISDEFSFYKKIGLPIPRYCPNCRYFERLKQRNPLNLWHRSCMKNGCTNEFETSYSPDRSEIIYCEKCYQQEIY